MKFLKSYKVFESNDSDIKNVEFINDYIKECKWDIHNSLANCAFFAKDFYQWCQKKGIECKLAYCEQSAPINSQCEQEDHIIPMIGRYLIDFVYTDKGVSHIVRENNKSEALKRQTNPEVTELSNFKEKYGKWRYKNIEVITYEQAFGKDGRCQTIELKETIKVPIEIGDSMKHLKSYKLFESIDEIKSTITDILRDNVLDKDIRLKIHTRNYTDIDNNPVEVIKIQIGDDFDDFLIRVDELKDDIITITNYLKDEGFEYNTFSYMDDHGDIHGDKGDVMKTVGLETNYLSIFYKKRIRGLN